MSILHLAAGQSLKEAIASHKTILLSPGRHRGGIRIDKNVKIIGEVGAVIEGDGSSPAICISGDEIEVALNGLSIENGTAEFGSGVLIEAYAEVSIESCRFKGNAKGAGGGAGIGILLGRASLKDCRFEANQDAFVSNIGEATFANCALLGGLSAYEGAQIQSRGGEIKGQLSIRGSSSRQPHILIDGTPIESIDNHATFPGILTRI